MSGIVLRKCQHIDAVDREIFVTLMNGRNVRFTAPALQTVWWNSRAITLAGHATWPWKMVVQSTTSQWTSMIAVQRMVVSLVSSANVQRVLGMVWSYIDCFLVMMVMVATTTVTTCAVVLATTSVIITTVIRWFMLVCIQVGVYAVRRNGCRLSAMVLVFVGRFLGVIFVGQVLIVVVVWVVVSFRTRMRGTQIVMVAVGK